MLLIPKTCFGSYKDVKKRSEKMAKELHKGVPAEQVFTADGFISAQEAHVPIFVNSHVAKGGRGDAFFPGFPLEQYAFEMFSFAKEGDFSDAFERARGLIKQLVRTEWGTLALTTDDAKDLWWFILQPVRQNKQRPDAVVYDYLRAVVQWWPSFEEYGGYFSSTQPEELAETPNGLRFVVGNIGLPDEIAQRPGEALLKAAGIQPAQV